uniref:Uncharacterized protein n=1 Tax=Globodera rostochiensis TaxID=31243 RepID=A0A914HIN6_GLORO
MILSTLRHFRSKGSEALSNSNLPAVPHIQMQKKGFIKLIISSFNFYYSDAPDGCPTVASEAIDDLSVPLVGSERLKRLWRGQKIIHKEEGEWDAPVAQLEELPTDWVEDVGSSPTQG